MAGDIFRYPGKNMKNIIFNCTIFLLCVCVCKHWGRGCGKSIFPSQIILYGLLNSEQVLLISVSFDTKEIFSLERERERERGIKNRQAQFKRQPRRRVKCEQNVHKLRSY